MDEVFHADFHGFVIDSGQGLSFAGKPVNMHPKELGVLVLLVRNASKRISKEDLISTVWKGAPTSDESISRSISVIKAHLRQASPGAESLIKTEYGQGYRFIGQVGKPASYVNEENFFMLINVSRNFIALKDGEGRWQIVNRFGLDLYELADKPWQGKTDLELAELSDACYKESFEWNRQSDEEVWQFGQPQQLTETILQSNAKKRIFDITKTPLFDVDGSRRALVVFGEDVTETLEADRQIRLVNRVLADSDEAVLISDADNNIIFVNEAFTKITGFTMKEAIGQNPRILASGRQTKAFYAEMWQNLLTEGSWHGEIWDRRKNGEIYPKWLNISCVHDNNGTISNYVGIFTDISKRKADEALLTFLAYHDPLTKLPNRLLLRDRFDQAVGLTSRGNNGMVALLFLDLDQFKNINDSLGHGIGDRLLVAVAKRLQSCVREVDTVSRPGGDEFVIVLTDLTDLNIVSVIAQKILEHIAQDFEIDEYCLSISTSIGIALYPEDGYDFDTILKLADTALYHAKSSGRNTYRFYTERMNVDAMERLHMRNDLARALTNNEFVLHYQPQFDLVNGRLLGVEALIRWEKPDSGLVPPVKFISIAEETGQIVPIGEWVIREACRQAQAWQQQGYDPVRVAVNLSSLQFKRGDVIEMITDLANEAGLDPQWLELELTETIMLQDVEYILEVVERLKSLSFTLSIDDFGTGYSNLSYLKRFRVDKLKIDQSFVRNMEVDRHDVAIIRAIIQLASGLDLRTIAEGVETEGQLELLRSEGCDEAQGYYFSHPLPANEVVGFMNKPED
jgi:diguanylate cyclase (GGDEF)-like protein/PAS domain S-box-containing protein